MRKALIATLSAVALIVGGFAATAGAQDDDPGTIVDVASANPDFSTLVTAVTEAGLVETLSGPGPFTVFAPTNEAFDALPAGTLDSLLADPAALTDVLNLHVVSGTAISSEQAVEAAGTNIDTLGGPVAVALDGDNLTVGGATVVQTDIEASNGVIHVIDSVIVEPAGAAEAPADAEAPAADAPAPTRVDTGTGGVAASSSVNALWFALLAGVAVMGIGSASVALVRNRRED